MLRWRPALARPLPASNTDLDHYLKLERLANRANLAYVALDVENSSKGLIVTPSSTRYSTYPARGHPGFDLRSRVWEHR
jgi:hypothetical protein